MHPDYIILSVGVNDRANNVNSTIIPAMRKLVDRMLSKYRVPSGMHPDYIILSVGIHFIRLGLDESTDRSMEKHLQSVRIADGKAVTVVDAVKEVAATYKFGMGKVVGLGTDGASVMASNLNGVNGLLTIDNPHLVFMHCVCHRLNLAVSQACTGIADMAALQSVLAAVYSFIQLSPTRLERFKEMAAVLAVDTLKFKRIYEIRYSTIV